MGVQFEEDTLRLEGVVYEDAVVGAREFLQQVAPQKVTFDFSACEDAHFALLQLVMAYCKLYEGEILYGDEVKIYQKVLEGFEAGENHCH
ncbi:MAG: hypothetical protein JXK05_02770 [Campylobacterales bacterium]|nr:hypothetical protein [Campylobacterales bacterium]